MLWSVKSAIGMPHGDILGSAVQSAKLTFVNLLSRGIAFRPRLGWVRRLQAVPFELPPTSEPTKKWKPATMTERPTKITFAEMRDMGVRGILVYCADYQCSHSIAISGDGWPDDLRLRSWASVHLPGMRLG
jgi:hypothetical protein